MNIEQRFLTSGLQAGNDANQAITDAIATKTSKMLGDALDANFQTLLEAKVSAAIQETILLHADKTKRAAKAFLTQAKTKMAASMIETQHNYRVSQIRASFTVDDLDAFDTDLNAEVKRLADESGTVSISTDATTAIGF